MSAAASPGTCRDVYCDVFGGLDDVLVTLPFGSPAQGTHCDPLHDVDLITICDADDHDDWDAGKGGAEAELGHARYDVPRLQAAAESNHDKKAPRADDAST